MDTVLRNRCPSYNGSLTALGLINCVLLAAASTLCAQIQAPAFIRTDTVWSGTVEVARDVSIMGADVRVQAGTTIRFSGGRGGKGAAIRLSSPLFGGGDTPRAARLILEGTADRPIMVETAEGGTPGSIELAPASTCVLDAQHVIFRRLGAASEKDHYAPAILLRLTAREDDVWLSDCRFESCGPVWVEFMGPEASGQIERCTFAKTQGPLAMSLSGPGVGAKIIRDNVGDAGIEIACPQTRMSNNVLVGEHASVVIRKGAAQGVAVEGNYVHCTTQADVGRYVVKAEAASTRLVENVLVGGSYVIETAPQTVERNVLVGASNLEADVAVTGAAKDLPGIRTMTHALVTNMCAECRVSGNLLLGPAYAAASVGKAVPFEIADNVFDGWGVARRALQFDVAAIGEARVTFAENVVGDYTQTPVVNESKQSKIDLQAGKNVFVGVGGPAYQGFTNIDGLARDDRRVESLTGASVDGAKRNLQMMKGSPATQAAADVDELLMSRRKSVGEVRKNWFEIYGRTGSTTASE